MCLKYLSGGKNKRKGGNGGKLLVWDKERNPLNYISDNFYNLYFI
jgi:hypothetical protein